MDLKLIPEEPCFDANPSTWTTGYWGQLFGACFWEMSLLDRNILQGEHDVLTQKRDLYARLCQLLLTYQEKYLLLQVKIYIEWFIDVTDKKSWWTSGSPWRNSDWWGFKRLLFSKHLNGELNINFLKIFPHISSNDTGL